jgi:peptidyl-prolyl cis-trans isomerase C
MRPGTGADENEVLQYYKDNEEQFLQEDTIRASHILITVDQDADEDEAAAAEQEILDLKSKLDAGADFAELAMEHSDCPSSAQGGDLGDFGRGSMVPPFEQAAFSVEVGEISDPVRTQFGFHLIKLTGKTEGEKLPFEQIRPQIAEYLANRKLDEKVRNHVEELRTKADIKVF